MFGSTRVHFPSSELRAALSAAEARVVARLEQRPTLSTSEIIARMEIPDAQRDQADRLLLALSNVLRVSPGKLRHDDILAELLGVDGDGKLPRQAYHAFVDSGRFPNRLRFGERGKSMSRQALTSQAVVAGLADAVVDGLGEIELHVIPVRQGVEGRGR